MLNPKSWSSFGPDDFLFQFQVTISSFPAFNVPGKTIRIHQPELGLNTRDSGPLFLSAYVEVCVKIQVIIFFLEKTLESPFWETMTSLVTIGVCILFNVATCIYKCLYLQKFLYTSSIWNKYELKYGIYTPIDMGKLRDHLYYIYIYTYIYIYLLISHRLKSIHIYIYIYSLKLTVKAAECWFFTRNRW